MAEWTKAPVLKTGSRFAGRGFESLPLRQHNIKTEVYSLLRVISEFSDDGHSSVTKNWKEFLLKILLFVYYLFLHYHDNNIISETNEKEGNEL